MEWYLKVLKQYADFNGRARRKEYWMFTLINFIIQMVLTMVGTAIMGETGALLGSIYSLGMLVPSIAVAIRRMHDVGKSGWYCLIPFYNLYLAVTDGDKGTNEYGPDPKGGSSEADTLDAHLAG